MGLTFFTLSKYGSDLCGTLQDSINDVALVGTVRPSQPSFHDLSQFLVSESHHHFFRIEFLDTLSFLFLLQFLVGLPLFFDFACPPLFDRCHQLGCKGGVVSLEFVNKPFDIEDGQPVVLGQSISDDRYNWASLLFPEEGVPWIRILLGLSPLAALNSATTEPIFATNPSFAFHSSSWGLDASSTEKSAVKMSKYSCKNPSSMSLVS